MSNLNYTKNLLHKIEKLEIQLEELKENFKEAFDDYQSSEGCSCCEDHVEHQKAGDKIYKLLENKS